MHCWFVLLLFVVLLLDQSSSLVRLILNGAGTRKPVLRVNRIKNYVPHNFKSVILILFFTVRSVRTVTGTRTSTRLVP